MTTVITCAITGAVTSRDQTPYLPVTPREIAESALEAAEAGASVAHIHVRDPETGRPSGRLEHYAETVDIIRQHNRELLINLTTGPGATFFPSQQDLAQAGPGTLMVPASRRVFHIQKLRPDLCSIDFNVMHQANDGIRINHRRVIGEMLRLVQEAGTKPELELFDSGDMRMAQEFVEQGVIKGRPFWQFAMGIKYGWPANGNALTFARRELGTDALWSAFGIGKQEMPMLAQTMLMGGHVRVGMEDNIYLRRGVLAKTNAELVKQAVEIIELLGGTVATPSEARKILLD